MEIGEMVKITVSFVALILNRAIMTIRLLNLSVADLNGFRFYHFDIDVYHDIRNKQFRKIEGRSLCS